MYDLKAPRLTQLSVGHFIEHRLGIKISATSHSIDVNQHPEVIQKNEYLNPIEPQKHVCSASYKQLTRELQQIKPRETHLKDATQEQKQQKFWQFGQIIILSEWSKCLLP